ncbi:MAG: xylose isomerase [Solibacterales bacterium]|nr:xylose isomerase [Bryobacterales bacterium]|tara:strand:- start:9865 stop:10740 length:876 start_codon:yes stop_codon:yes gene_type:complete
MVSRRNFLGTSTALLSTGLEARSLPLTQKPPSITKAILVSMLPKELSYLDRFRLAVEIGFKEVEMRTVSNHMEAISIKKAADKAGIRIHSVMNQAHWQYPLSSPKALDVEMSMRGMQISLHQAKLYDADTVLLVPAVVRSDTTYEQAWERSQEKIRQLIPLAEKLNIIIAIEEVWNKFLLTARDFVQFIDEFNHPLIQAYLDVGNMVHYGVPQHWIREVGKRIVKVHLKDYSRRSRQFVNLGEGDVDWKGVRKAFSEIGYAGTATVELKAGNRNYLEDVSVRVNRLLELAG